MITKIYPAEYSHIDSLLIGGVKLESHYNQNYYVNQKNLNIIIFEDYNDDGKFDYRQVFIVDGKKIETDLGCDYGKYSIFAGIPGDYGFYEDENGYYVELDTELC